MKVAEKVIGKYQAKQFKGRDQKNARNMNRIITW